MKVHTCRRCGADVEMWIKPGTNWQCQCYAWNIFQPPPGSFDNPRPYTPESFMASFKRRIETDQKTVAERQWAKPKLAPKPQKACDHGLFSDEANQLDLVEMLQEPTNGK